MTRRGASSDSLMMNVDTDFGPFVSLGLNSLFANSLFSVSPCFYLHYAQDKPTLGFHPLTVDNHTAPQGCVRILP